MKGSCSSRKSGEASVWLACRIEDPFSVLTLCLLSAMNNSFERKRSSSRDGVMLFFSLLGHRDQRDFP